MPAKALLQIPQAHAQHFQRIFKLMGLQAALLFLSSGRLDWIMAWLYITSLGLLSAISLFVLLSQHPDLIDERANVPLDAKPWDKVISALIFLMMSWVLPIIAGLDMRFSETMPLPWSIQIISLSAYSLVYLLGTWAIYCNRFFSLIVRVQTDRDHTVITTGPYHYIRHPGHLSMVLCMLSLPLALGTLWAFIPASFTILLIIVRTTLEDDTLRRELPGYAEYMTKVHYRFIPWLW